METVDPIQLNPDPPELWNLNAVLNGVSRSHETGWHEGTASLKFVLRGSALWRTPNRSFRIQADRFVMFHEGQPYQLSIDSRIPTETLAVFFRPGYFEELGCVNPCLRHSDGMMEAAVAVRDLLVASAEPWETWEAFRLLATRLLGLKREWGAEAAQLGYLGSRTRSEVIPSLYRARDLIVEEACSRLTLKQVAAEAAMSPHHFHSLFSKAFSKTPHQFLTSERMRRAERLVCGSDIPVGEAALAVGYESESHFNRIYRRTFGESPGRHRKNRKIGQ